MSDTEEDHPFLKSSKYDDQKLFCDVGPIQPEQLVKAENCLSGLDLEKLLLERMLLRKELRLKSMQDKLSDQSLKLAEAEEKLREYESLPGLQAIHSCCKLFLKTSQQTRNTRQFASLLFKAFFIVFYSLQSWVNHLYQLVALGYGHLVRNVRDRVSGECDNWANEWAERGREDERKRNNRRRSRA